LTSYFVYYRIDPARADALRKDVERIFDVVERATGVRGRWMRRRDEPSTYMEVYENVRDAKAFEALLERESAALDLERHIERFVCA
jgi:IMP cyclohydrolase